VAIWYHNFGAPAGHSAIIRALKTIRYLHLHTLTYQNFLIFSQVEIVPDKCYNEDWHYPNPLIADICPGIEFI
jgi:hypothetical protein